MSRAFLKRLAALLGPVMRPTNYSDAVVFYDHGSWDESKHPRDHGKFAHVAGAQGEHSDDPKEPAASAAPLPAPREVKRVGQQASTASIRGPELAAELAGKKVYQGVPADKVEAIHRFDVSEGGIAELIERKGGRPRYIYTDAHEAKKAAKKFEKTARLADKIQGFRETYTKDLESKDSKTRSNAIAAALIDNLAIRMGGDAESKRTGSIGVSTMRREHLTLGEGFTRLDFPGKSGHAWSVEVRNPKIIKALEDAAMGKKPGDNLLETRKEEINQYIGVATGGKVKEGSKKTGGATAKDFRTLHGTIAAREMLKSVKLPTIPEEPKLQRHEAPKLTGNKAADKLAMGAHKAATKASERSHREATKARATAIKAREKAIKDAVAGAYVAASKRLNNTPSVAKAAYVDPAVITDFVARSRA